MVRLTILVFALSCSWSALADDSEIGACEKKVEQETYGKVSGSEAREACVVNIAAATCAAEAHRVSAFQLPFVSAKAFCELCGRIAVMQALASADPVGELNRCGR